jgi:RNA polymerase sigma-70 factor (ECF subfamily)
LLQLLPNEPEVLGLLALMLLIDSRRAARVGASGEMVPLMEQDRSRWDLERIREGQALVRRCLVRNEPGPYQLQAAINAVHAEARRADEVDWRQILQLYDQLFALQPNPIVALNRAVALAEVEGPSTALALVDQLDLAHYYLFHAIRADLLRRLDRHRAAAEAYDAAIARCGNTKERELMQRRRATSDSFPRSTGEG